MRTISQYIKETKNKGKTIPVSIDVETELIRILTEQISLEIDREMLTNIRLNNRLHQ